MKIRTKDGRQTEFTIVTLTSEAIVGKDERIEMADVATIERRELSQVRTAALVGGMLLGALVVVTILMVAFAVALVSGGL